MDTGVFIQWLMVTNRPDILASDSTEKKSQLQKYKKTFIRPDTVFSSLFFYFPLSAQCRHHQRPHQGGPQVRLLTRKCKQLHYIRLSPRPISKQIRFQNQRPSIQLPNDVQQDDEFTPSLVFNSRCSLQLWMGKWLSIQSTWEFQY